MTQDIDPVAHNRDAWDRLVQAGDEWTRPVPSAVIERARKGEWSVVLIGHKPAPREWFPPVPFCPDLAPVWRECHRVLRPGGELIAGFLNPDLYIFDVEALDERAEFVVRHALPYSDLTHLTAEERARVRGEAAPIEYSHTMSAQLGGQIAAGFVITGFEEAPHHSDLTAPFMPGYFATRARKPG